MQFKSIALSIAVAQAINLVTADGGQEYWKSFNSSVDPLNINVPEISQTSSNDPTQECVHYNPDPSLFQVNQAEWPTVWKTATSNNMNTSTEFQNLYNSIDWNSAPKIEVRKLKPDGSVDMTGYDEANDPDCWWSSSGCTVPKMKDVNPDIYECPEPETWGLTYDDGPNCSHNAFYDYLEQQKLHATMFYIGSNVIDWPYGAMRGIKDGHHIAAHTWSHQLMTTLTNQELLAEFYYTQKAIKLATGVTPRYWRPPFGDVDDRVRWIATQLNLTTVLWNLDTNDWSAGVDEPVQEVQQAYEDYIQMGSNGTFANSGNIVLTHEINNETMSLALKNLPAIQKAYKNVINVATCQNITYPYMERTIAFRPFADAIAQKNDSGIAASDLVGSSTSGPVTATASSLSSAGASGSSSDSSSSDAISMTSNSIVAAALMLVAAIFSS
ncbi:chitin deacetylase [Radiomyces spectabilis]|uniref:chitin deacetylase n=1 Tax=Radiomyces spectabilis TaxID=64574 RepID=UPI00221F750C|nr:chitin deacetylase [Radiomyces spectabilis]KAI8364750.1 chitin deacetylase [Radiomyces spectabilis]